MTRFGKILIAASLTVPAMPLHAQQQPFYAAPAALPKQAGSLLRAERITPDWAPENAATFRILYTTRGLDGRMRPASAIVLIPNSAIGTDARGANIIAWAHGTTGIDQNSAPSLQKNGLESGAMFIGQKVIDAGWAMVATDYVGLGTKGPHQYLVGVPAGRAVLDALRAARAMKDGKLNNRVVVWGHSQGGAAALWTGVIAPRYAPDVHIAGVAALAPASDVSAVLGNLRTALGGTVLSSYVITGYSNTYPDVRFAQYVRPDQVRHVREMASHGLSSPSTMAAALQDRLSKTSIWAKDPQTGALAARMAENTPAGKIAAPLLLAQGTKDEIVPAVSNERFAELQKRNGTRVNLIEFPLDHVGLVKAGSPLIPQLIAWTTDQFGSYRPQ